MFIIFQQRRLHLRLWKDSDGGGGGEDSDRGPEAHRQHGHRGCPEEVRQYEEKSQISRGNLWIIIVFCLALFIRPGHPILSLIRYQWVTPKMK